MDAGYVGSDEVCLACHEASHKGYTARYNKTIHSKVLTPQNGRSELARRGCELLAR